MGPVTTEKLDRLGLRTIADLHRIQRSELAQTLGRTHAEALLEFAHARDDRPVEPEREAKSISVEDTFEVDLVNQSALQEIIERDARQVSARLRAARLFARTVTLKIKRHDFSTHTRSRTVSAPTDRPELISEVARSLLGTVEVTGGVRLVGVGVAGLTDVRQDRLFDDEQGVDSAPAQFHSLDDEPDGSGEVVPGRSSRAWPPGADVRHEIYGEGWVWGSGRGRVTVRFESRDTPPGPVRTFDEGDPALSRL